MNWAGLANFTPLGSTVTLTAISRTEVLGAGATTMSLVPRYSGIISSITLILPSGALPAGTPVTFDTSVELVLPPPGTNEGSTAALGRGVGFSLSAGGLEPQGPVTVILYYNPFGLPAGTNPKTLQLARYDALAGQWTFLPTSVDTSLNTLLCQLDHFSLYAPFSVAAASTVDGVNVFPNPWEPGSGSPLYDAPSLTFSNLPAGARVRLFDLLGEFLWGGNAAASGVLQWDGSNRFGRKLATGTYLAVIEGGGKRTVRRVVLIR